MDDKIKKIKKLLDSEVIQNQLEAVTILKEEGYISSKIRDFLSIQHTIPRHTYLTPNKYIEIVISDSKMFINFTYNHYQKGEIIEEIGTIKNLKRVLIQLVNKNQVPESLMYSKSLSELRLIFLSQTYPIDYVRAFRIFSKIKKLNTLELNYFRIKSVPKEINRLKTVKRLLLHSNSIMDVPKEIGELDQLEILDLTNNQLEEIPKEIGDLKHLKMINLRNNKLTNIPRNILKMDSLNHIDISDNKIERWIFKDCVLRKKKALILKG